MSLAVSMVCCARSKQRWPLSSLEPGKIDDSLGDRCLVSCRSPSFPSPPFVCPHVFPRTKRARTLLHEAAARTMPTIRCLLLLATRFSTLARNTQVIQPTHDLSYSSKLLCSGERTRDWMPTSNSLGKATDKLAAFNLLSIFPPQ